MEIIVRRPKIEPVFQAVIYRASPAPGRPLYRVLIGAEGSEVKLPDDYLEFVEASDFLGMAEVERWAEEKARKISEEGNAVEFDDRGSFLYLMARVVEEMASDSESPIMINERGGEDYG
jgi:hypothetical protein